MSITADLHMHSYYSDDGEFTPSELVKKCKQRSIHVMAITDHNCARANAEGARSAREAGIAYIPAIEIDCAFQGINLHVIGYGIDPGSPDFKSIEDAISRGASAASREMLSATQRLGFCIGEQDMAALAEKMYWKDRWTGEMFAEALLNKPEYAGHELLRPYRPGGPRGNNPYANFYWDFYSQGKPCYAENPFPSLGRVLEIIHGNGGKAVLAHPAVNLKGRSEDTLGGIISCGLDGIEAFSSYHTPQQADRYYRWAKARRLLVTCGSDYHGKTKPSIVPGQHGCTLPDDEMKALLTALNVM